MQTRELFSIGRFVFLGEVDEATDEAVLCPYVCESLINWQESSRRTGSTTTMIVLQEAEYQFKDGDEFEQEIVTTFRELRLRTEDEQQAESEGVYQVRTWKSRGSSTATTGVDATVEQDWAPIERLGNPYDFIPIVVSNSHDTGLDYGRIPILPISKISLNILRLSADYKRALYVKGDPQAVVYGIAKEDAPETIGGSEIWTFDDPNAKAEYLDLDGQGIPLMRDAIRDEFERYVAAAGRLLEHSQRNGQESGQAVEKRLNAQHVTIAAIVIKGGQAMESALRMIGRMMGMDESDIDGIEFVPNVDFVEATMTGQELLQLVSAKNMGAPLSKASIHELMKKGRLTDKTFEDEQSAIDSEPPSVTGLTQVEPDDTPPDDQ
jgi:hypothetical protein